MTEESEITLEHDQLMGFHEKMAAAEGEAASDAGTRRQEIGAFIEKTGVHKKAFSQIRAGLKIKKEGDKLDWLRSMELMIGMAGAHIRGQSTAEMDFEADDPRIPEQFTNDAEGLGRYDFGRGYERHQSPFRGELDQVKKGMWERGWDDAAEKQILSEQSEEMTADEVNELAADMDQATDAMDEDDDAVVPFDQAQA